MNSERIAHGYFFAKQYVIKKGYADEIDWQDGLNYDSITEQKFLEEASWVILSSGMNEKVIRKIFPLIRSSMYEFKSAELILKKKKLCLSKSLSVFNHRGKINAILFIAEYISKHSFDFVRSQIKIHGVSFLTTFPYLGKATAFHLAKNLGLEVVKPDRHLIRISNVLGFQNPAELCQLISKQISEKISLVDLVLWRYATLDKNYSNRIGWFIKKHQD